jgi:hypothetical protein
MAIRTAMPVALALVALGPSEAADVAPRIAPSAAMATARASHSLTVLPDGTALVAGGFGGSGTEDRPYSTTEVFDPATGRFSAGPSLRVGRLGHTATLLPDGRVLVAGGWTAASADRASTEWYETASRRFVRGSAMRLGRAGHTATLLQDGRVLIVGGVDGRETPLSSAELYDPGSGVSFATGAMTVPRESHTATLLPDGSVLITGGHAGRYPDQQVQRTAERYDPRTGRFTPVGPMSLPRHKHAAAGVPDGRVLVVAGSDDRDWRGRYASAEIFDPRTNRFVPAGSLHQARFKLPMALVKAADGRVFVLGGAETAEVFDPATGRFDEVEGSLGAAQFYGTAAMLPGGQMLVAGGYAEGRDGLPSTREAYLVSP